MRDVFVDRAAFDTWAQQYIARLQQEHSDDTQRSTSMKRINPKYILRNYLAQQAIDLAKNNDFSMVQNLLQVLLAPFDEHPAFEALPLSLLNGASTWKSVVHPELFTPFP